MGGCVRVRVCARACVCLQLVKSEVKELLCVMYLYTLVYIPHYHTNRSRVGRIEPQKQFSVASCKHIP